MRRAIWLCLGLPSIAIAEPAADPSVEAAVQAPGETVVVASRAPEDPRDVPATVTVVGRAAIAHSPLVLADDIARAVPSVGTFRRSSSAIADPTSQGLSLRGVGPSAVSRALVLRDGVPANDPFGGWMYWRAVSPLSIDRLEVAPGGASALFGNFALGGVIDLRSRPIESGALDAVLAGGSLGTARAAVRASDRLGPVGFVVDGEAFRTGGYTPITAAQRGAVDGDASSAHGTASARVELARGASTWHATARWFDETLDAGTLLTTAGVRAVTYGGGWQLAREHATLNVELFGGDQRFLQDRARVAPDRATATLASHQETPSNDQGASAAWSQRAGAHAFVVGADARRVAGTATDALAPSMVEAGTLVERSAGGEQRFAGVFAQDTLHAGSRVAVFAALRLDAWQNRDGATRLRFGDDHVETTQLADRAALQLDPRAGVLVHVSRVVAVRASVYRAFRAPTLNELYRPFQVGTVLTAANAELRPETLWGAEVGPQLALPGLDVRATAFWNQLHDAIANVTLDMPLPSGAARQRRNLGEARIAGLELSAAWHPAPAWTVSIAHVFVDAEVTSAPATPALVGKPLPQDPALRTTATVTYDEPRIATVTGQVRHLGRMFEDDLATLPIESVVLVDAQVARAITRGVSAFVSVQNLFDRRYLVGRAGVDTEGAPRTLEVGLAYHR